MSISVCIGTQDLLSLTVENALADLAAFMRAQEAALGGGKRTWLMVGGSYPGALSSWFRLKYPDLATASWSSSGVILAVEKFTRFDEIVAEVVGPNCADALRQVTAAWETEWDMGGGRKADLLSLFNTPDTFTKADMAWMLADAAAMGAQYGGKKTMCDHIVPVRGNPGALLAQFATWIMERYGDSFGSGCYYSTACLSDPAQLDQWYDAKPWVWQARSVNHPSFL